MADLVREFFKRDLSESELDALGKLLQKSSEDVLRFETQLEKYYVSLGLPHPALPKVLHALPKAGGWWGSFLGGGGLKVLAVAAAIGTATGVTLWKLNSSPSPAAKTSLSAPLPPAMSTVPTVARPASKPALALPALAPPSVKGEELSVVLDAAQNALVTVRVLDSSSKEVRVLYAGFVEPGRREFHWDGLLTNGQPADPGDYEIDLQSGSKHLVKKIKIRP